jgi:hypothetical protein
MVGVVEANRFSELGDAQRYAIEKIDEAIAAGELQPLTGTGEPIPNLTRDPDWWLRAFLERERYAERLAEIESYRRGIVAESITTEHLADARERMANLNDVLERWNENAPPEFSLEPVSEIWLITERARAPGY